MKDARRRVTQARAGTLPAALDRRFEAVVFDWDGTAVPDRQADAEQVREAIKALCALGMQIAVISGTHLGNVDGQLGRARRGRGACTCCSTGAPRCSGSASTVPSGSSRGRRPTPRRRARQAAELTVERLAARGLRAEIVSQRLNRRKIDLIPEPEWADPPKARIVELLEAIEARLAAHGISSLAEAAELARGAAVEVGLPEARVTSDAKHVEIGLTDKADSGRWITRFLWRQGVGAGLVLIAGDEFGALGGLPGSDSLMLVPEAARSPAVSVGAEPTGVPDGVVAVPGGPEAFLSLLHDQLRRRRERAVPESGRRTPRGRSPWTVSTANVSVPKHVAHAGGRHGSAHVEARSGAIRPRRRPCLPRGLYGGAGSEKQLQPGPRWNALPFDLEPRPRLERVLDLRTGLLHQRLDTGAGKVRSVSLSALSRPGTVALRVEAPGACSPTGAPGAPGTGPVEAVARATRAGCVSAPSREGCRGGRRRDSRRRARTPAPRPAGRLRRRRGRTSRGRPRARRSRRGPGGRLRDGCCASTAPPGPRAGRTPTSDRGRRRPPAGGAPRALPPDGVGRPSRARPPSGPAA